MSELLKAVILGIVEGVTEFIPVSSTGHLIVASKILNFDGPTASTFEVFIQLGAILAIVVLYRERFFGLLQLNRKDGFAGIPGLTTLAITSFPAFFLGALAHGYIKEHLFNTTTVAIGLGLGGVALLFAERWDKDPRVHGLDSITWRHALLIGMFQCLALWPGTSRAAATIIGAMILGLDRKTAVEYSFFAAVPVIAAASLYDLYKSFGIMSSNDIGIFAAGLIVSFFAAWLSVKFFIRLLSHNTIRIFAWYRIAAAPLIYFFLR